MHALWSDEYSLFISTIIHKAVIIIMHSSAQQQQQQRVCLTELTEVRRVVSTATTSPHCQHVVYESAVAMTRPPRHMHEDSPPPCTCMHVPRIPPTPTHFAVRFEDVGRGPAPLRPGQLGRQGGPGQLGRQGEVGRVGGSVPVLHVLGAGHPAPATSYHISTAQLGWGGAHSSLPWTCMGVRCEGRQGVPMVPLHEGRQRVPMVPLHAVYHVLDCTYCCGIAAYMPIQHCTTGRLVWSLTTGHSGHSRSLRSLSRVSNHTDGRQPPLTSTCAVVATAMGHEA